MKLKINVTQACIDDGIPCDTAFCPIALAVKKVQADGLKTYNAYVSFSHCIIEDKMFSLPLVAERFIHDFDGHCPVKPFSFELSV